MKIKLKKSNKELVRLTLTIEEARQLKLSLHFVAARSSMPVRQVFARNLAQSIAYTLNESIKGDL